MVQNQEVVSRKYDLLLERLSLSIDAINVRLNKISHEHEELRQKPNIPNEYQEFKTSLTEKMKGVLNSVDDFSIQLKYIKSEVRKEASRNDKERLEIDNHEIIIKEIIRSIESNKNELTKKVKSLGDAISQVSSSSRHNLDKEIDKFKKYLNEKPSEIEPIKKELEKKIEIASVDRDGVMKEIAVVKKSLLITEKQIENIYTLLERVNKKVSS